MAEAISPKRRVAVCISAGEASGDAYAARLIEALQKEWQDCESGWELSFGGLAGRRTRALGVPLIQDTSEWGAIGITQAARIFMRVCGSLFKTKGYLTSTRPGLFIPIDFGYANIKLARHARRKGWKVLYFVPPGSWRRDRQGKDLPHVTDAIVTPFGWSEEMLRAAGANVYWFGHPIKQLIAEQREKLSLVRSGSKGVLAILPGSREHEIEANLPLIAEVVKNLDVRIEIALTPSANKEEFAARWKSFSDKPATLTVGKTADVLLRARAAIVCSGTATLEAALCDCPMVVIYELPKILKVEMRVRWFKKPKYISLPNIMLDRLSIPEHVEMEGISADLVRQQISSLLEDGPEREKQLQAFSDLKQLLGPSDAIDRTAQLAAKMLVEITTSRSRAPRPSPSIPTPPR